MIEAPLVKCFGPPSLGDTTGERDSGKEFLQWSSLLLATVFVSFSNGLD